MSLKPHDEQDTRMTNDKQVNKDDKQVSKDDKQVNKDNK